MSLVKIINESLNTTSKYSNTSKIQEHKNNPQHSWSNLWLFFIALYCIVQLLEKLLKFTILYYTYNNIEKVLEILLSI